MKRIFLLISLIANTLLISAQVSVEAEIDSIQIFVGQQTHLKLTTTVQPSAKVEFPQFQPTQMITPGVEVLACQEEKKDAGDGFEARSMVYTLTSFDDTLYYLPPMTVKVDGKQYKSKSLALKVFKIILSCGVSGVYLSGSVC